ncbi:putative integral membrane protein [Rosellinia necatrix]|uniref:Putative integral membrane protein n=1 Tax=Rosellinia necatrix TaxID=77044 RepID=A0A1S8A7R6_ROSNE|nr:putative integral membrane protein [Rosellinia necatrix]
MADSDFYSLPFDQQVEIFNNLPSLPAPEGVEPDYDHPRARNDVTIAVTVVGLAFTTVLFALRVYSRLFIVKKVRLEDCECLSIL